MSFPRVLGAFPLFALLAGCAAAPLDPGTDEGNTTDERALAVDKTFIVTRQDFNKCAYPMCGGVYVKAVNQAKTTCFGGSKQAECYVAEIDLSALGLSPEQESNVRGSATAGHVLVTGHFAIAQGSTPKLVAKSAADDRTDAAATGTFYFVESSGIVCITTPCPTLEAHKLNTVTVKSVTDVDLSALGLSVDEAAAAVATMHEEGLAVSGVIQLSGETKKLVVSQVFDAVEPEPKLELCLTDDACGEGAYCDMTECLSGCAPDMVCPAVCYGACQSGAPPAPVGGSCVGACGGQASDETCYCDAACTYYGDCCGDYLSTCN